jgi:hypothetical protein
MNIGARSDPVRADGRGEQKEGGEEDRCPWGAPSFGLIWFRGLPLAFVFPHVRSGVSSSHQSDSPLSPPHPSATSFSGIRFRHAFPAPGYYTDVHAA